MIHPSPLTKVFICTESVDFRKGIDGLVGVCKILLKKDPFSGAFFVFRNRSAHSLKILVYDGQGFWVCQKRLSKGKFHWWPKGETISELAANKLSILLWNGDAQSSKIQEDWRSLT